MWISNTVENQKQSNKKRFSRERSHFLKIRKLTVTEDKKVFETRFTDFLSGEDIKTRIKILSLEHCLLEVVKRQSVVLKVPIF